MSKTNPNIYGGGSLANINGLLFEQTTQLSSVLLQCQGVDIVLNNVIYNGTKIGQLCGGNKLYKEVLEKRGVDYKQILSKKLKPDEAILVNNVVYIIEKKFQSVPGSVDEKIQTCHYKKLQYSKLFNPISINVEYIYLFNDWFNKQSYSDTLKYIHDTGNHYYFNYLPLSAIGLTILTT